MITPSANVRLRFRVGDLGAGSIVEGGGGRLRDPRSRLRRR
ncbi:MAG: hypothetical protein R3E96_03395 [Planctomycetota bacterium]